jgi:hypothetical protein
VHSGGADPTTHEFLYPCTGNETHGRHPWWKRGDHTVVDYWSALVSPDTETYVVALTVDGVHPSPPGAGDGASGGAGHGGG